MKLARKTTRFAGLLLASAAVILAVSSPAVAKPDPGDSTNGQQTTKTSVCSLQRIGTQFVRCDELTGAGAMAPSWVPER